MELTSIAITIVVKCHEDDKDEEKDDEEVEDKD